MDADVERKLRTLELELHALNDTYKVLADKINDIEPTVKTNADLYNNLSKQVHEQLNMEPLIKVPYWLEDGGKLPERKKDGDIGYDAYLNEDKVIKAHTAEKVSLGIGMGVPRGFGVHAVNRGGCYLGKIYDAPIDVGEPWVDCNYRGIINALIQNNGDKDIEVHKGDRVCSVNIVKTYAFDFVPLEEYLKEVNMTEEEFMNTNRGDTGFGNSGIK